MVAGSATQPMAAGVRHAKRTRAAGAALGIQAPNHRDYVSSNKEPNANLKEETRECLVNHDASFSPARSPPGPGCWLPIVSRPPQQLPPSRQETLTCRSNNHRCRSK